MLKVLANLYSSNKEGFEEIVRSLKSLGYDVALETDTNGVIVKEVSDES